GILIAVRPPVAVLELLLHQVGETLVDGQAIFFGNLIADGGAGTQAQIDQTAENDTGEHPLHDDTPRKTWFPTGKTWRALNNEDERGASFQPARSLLSAAV